MKIATDAAMGAVPLFNQELFELLCKNCPGHELRQAKPDQPLGDAEIFLGQPSVKQIMMSEHLRWFQVTSAGYTRFDTPTFRTLARERGIMMTNSSSVYDQPCAQHLLAFMLAHARVLPEAFRHQQNRQWQRDSGRYKSVLLNGQKVLIYGYGAIAKELIRLLAPFQMEIIAVRRRPQKSAEPVKVVGIAESDQWLGWADHVVNTLPANAESEYFFSGVRLGKLKQSAAFYNIGRGTTVDQGSLIHYLNEGTFAAAYLDVTDPEPLPPDDPLWTTPRCTITSHYGGGFRGEGLALGQHFVANLERYVRGEPLKDQIM